LARASWLAREMPIMSGILAALLVNSITVEGLGAVANVSSMWLVIIVGWSAAACCPAQPRATAVIARLGRGRAPGEAAFARSVNALLGVHGAGVLRKNAVRPLGVRGKGILTHGEFQTDRVSRAK
jgi:hypothetical protein